MKEESLKNIITEALKKIAPEANPDLLKPDEDLREKLNLDSFDFLQFIIAISKKTGVDIPEKDYEQAKNMKQFILYLQSKIT